MSTKPIALTRRDFVRGSVGVTLGATGIGMPQPKTVSAAEAETASKVVVVRNEKVLGLDNKVDAGILKTMLEDTVIRVTGQKTAKEAWLSLFKPTDKIGLVSTPALVKTHEELIQAVTAALVDAGVPKENITMAQGGPAKIEACTALINMPGLKAHWLTGIGTVLKNYIMFSGHPRDYHDANNAKLGEIWDLPIVKGKTKLNLVDAIRPLCDKGPQVDPKYLWNYNGLIAGVDPVAVEAVCLKIISEKRKAVRNEPLTPPPLCVEAADKTYRLGVSDMAKIKVDIAGWTQDSLL